MTKQDIELKNCPFCGGEQRIRLNVDLFGSCKDSQQVCVCCNTCNCTSKLSPNMVKAIENWNTRPSEVNLQNKVDILMEAVRLIGEETWIGSKQRPVSAQMAITAMEAIRQVKEIK